MGAICVAVGAARSDTTLQPRNALRARGLVASVPLLNVILLRCSCRWILHRSVSGRKQEHVVCRPRTQAASVSSRGQRVIWQQASSI